MTVIDSVAGALTMDVASEGNMIRKGTEVVIREVFDNFRNFTVPPSNNWWKIRSK